MLIREVWPSLLVLCSIGRSEDNVALTKTVEQSSDYVGHNKWVADKAVDGCENTDVYSDCCTLTGPNTKEAWWRVDLGELMTVNKITMYYSDAFQVRFAGYHLYLSNTTDTPTDGVLCYKDQSRNKADVQLVVTHECPYVARYVTVYNYRNDTKRHNWYSNNSFIELCEVQVYGCPIGMYGDGDCNNRCSAACYGGNCNPTTGACFYCFPGKYGEFCNNECPTNCKTNSCEKDSGFCFACKAEFHGSTCAQSCPPKCANNKCFQNTDICTECVAGLYGLDCTEKCPINCFDECHRSTAECKVTSQAECTSITPVAIGIGTGCGLVIVVLVIVVILLVRRLSRIQSDKKTHGHVTNMSELNRGEINKDDVERQGSVNDIYERLDID